MHGCLSLGILAVHLGAAQPIVCHLAALALWAPVNVPRSLHGPLLSYDVCQRMVTAPLGATIISSAIVLHACLATCTVMYTMNPHQAPSLSNPCWSAGFSLMFMSSVGLEALGTCGGCSLPRPRSSTALQNDPHWRPVCPANARVMSVLCGGAGQQVVQQ
jgi:hypothetical protein